MTSDLDGYLQRADALGRAGQQVAALQVLREAEPLFPADRRLFFLRGLLHQDAKQYPEAAEAYRAALAVGGDAGAVWCNLGDVLRRLGDETAALDAFDRAARSEPGMAAIHHNRGALLRELGRLADAEAAFRAAVSLQADLRPARRALAVCLALQRRFTEAFEEFDRLVADAPRDAALRTDRATASLDAARYRAAIEDAEAAVAIDSGALAAWQVLGRACHKLDELDAARVAFGRLAELRPHDPLSSLLPKTLGPTVFEDTQAIDAYRDALEHRLADAAAAPWARDLSLEQVWSADVRPDFDLPFHGRDDRPIKELYARLVEPGFREFTPPPPAVGPRPRVGFAVTADQETLFARLFGGLLRRLDADALEIVVLAPEGTLQRLRATLQAPAATYLSLPTDPRRIASQRRGCCDLLLTRSIGTTKLAYFLPYLRLAPVQATTWGIQVTSGIPAVDYYVSSRLTEPDGAADHYSERLVLLDNLPAYVSRVPKPDPMPSRAELGLPEDKTLYATPQQAGKFHPDFDPLLAMILKKDPRGVLVWTSGSVPELMQRVRKRFVRRFRDLKDRVLLLPSLQGEKYYGLLWHADVLLDPLHFGGVNSSYDAFSFGRPVVSFPSHYHRGRYTLGCYRAMGIEEAVATNPYQYVQKALRVGTDRDYRDELRRRLLDASSVLFDNPAVVSEWQRLLGDLAQGRAG